tara:strand:+ start:765 stop:1358 length:594 start_codon:yes stop_codon:yes gene_type:complete
MRKCNNCKIEKPLEEYSKDKSRSLGRSYRCKPCSVKVHMEKYYDKQLITQRGKYNEYYKERRANKTEEELEKDREYQRNWEKNNKEKVNEYHKRTREKNPNLKIGQNVRTRMYQVLKGINKHAPTLKLLGCSIKDYKLYLESKFDENMSWDNYGTYWEIDHIKCLYKFDLTQHTQQMEAFNFTNTQPLEVTENRKKR